MSPETTHKLMGLYMEGLILSVNAMYMLFCFFKLFPIGCIGFKHPHWSSEWYSIRLKMTMNLCPGV